MLLDRYPEKGFAQEADQNPTSVEQLLDDPNAPSWIVVAAQDPIGLVANKLVMAGQGSCALVECDEGFVVGIFTEQDYLRALNTDSSDCGDEYQCSLEQTETEAKAVQIFSLPVADFATQVEQLRTVEPTCSVVRALRIMGSRGFRHLPVVRAGSRPEALPSSAVLGVLSITSLTTWLQRDSEALQAKYLETLFDINPRWRREGEGEAAGAAAALNEPRLPLMLSFGAGDEMVTALSADLLVIMAYRSAWVMADNWLGESALVNLGIFAAAVPAIWWLRGKPGYADEDDEDDADGSAATEEQRQADAAREVSAEAARNKGRAGRRRRMKSILNDV